jgi:hypothetical protein
MIWGHVCVAILIVAHVALLRVIINVNTGAFMVTVL